MKVRRDKKKRGTQSKQTLDEVKVKRYVNLKEGHKIALCGELALEEAMDLS
jgi:hypothetical protein